MNYPSYERNAVNAGRFDLLASTVQNLSAWIDEAQPPDRDPEALMWHRVMKASEEAGEVTNAMIALVGGNPRKVSSRPHHELVSDLRKELLDVAVSAMAAVEHIDGNIGTSMLALTAHVRGLADRMAQTRHDQAVKNEASRRKFGIESEQIRPELERFVPDWPPMPADATDRERMREHDVPVDDGPSS
jgi:outer membrane murein-binding lipoprotein Lpp